MRVIFAGEIYECIRAVRTDDRVTLYPTNGGTVEFVGVSDFSAFAFEDGSWSKMTAHEARTKRDKLLAETDWTQVLDAPISAESREAFRVYRQALRDITEQPGFPEVIDWPVKPEVVKAAPDPVDTALDVLIGEEES